MRPSDNAVRTALNIWRLTRYEDTKEAWHECWIAMDAIFYFHCHEQANPVDRAYFLEMRNAAFDMMEAK